MDAMKYTSPARSLDKHVVNGCIQVCGRCSFRWMDVNDWRCLDKHVSDGGQRHIQFTDGLMLWQTCCRWKLTHWRNMFQMDAYTLNKHVSDGCLHIGETCFRCMRCLDIHFSNAMSSIPRHTLCKWTNMLSMNVYKFVEDVHSDGWMSSEKCLYKHLQLVCPSI